MSRKSFFWVWWVGIFLAISLTTGLKIHSAKALSDSPGGSWWDQGLKTENIIWLGGEVAIGTGDEWFHDVGWLPNRELGLLCMDEECDSGVLVFRRKEGGR